MSEIEQKLKEQEARIEKLRMADEQADKEFIAANPDQAHQFIVEKADPKTKNQNVNEEEGLSPAD